MSDPRESKLPRWAQEALADERRRADTAERKLAAHKETVQKTRIWFGHYDNPIYVPVFYGHERVHFDLGELGEHYTEVQVGFTRDGRLEVQGGHSLSVDMQSSNTFQVRFNP